MQKFVTLKSWKYNTWALKIVSNLLSTSLGCFLASGSGKTWIRKKNVKKFEIARFVKKIAKIRDVKM